jgi:hypothetical protein
MSNQKSKRNRRIARQDNNPLVKEVRYNKVMRKTVKETNMSGSVMDNFFKGMRSISLFPQLPRYEELPRVSPRQGVADAFAQAGNSMWAAIKQFDAELKKRPSQ